MGEGGTEVVVAAEVGGVGGECGRLCVCWRTGGGEGVECGWEGHVGGCARVLEELSQDG